MLVFVEYRGVIDPKKRPNIPLLFFGLGVPFVFDKDGCIFPDSIGFSVGLTGLSFCTLKFATTRHIMYFDNLKKLNY